MDQKKHNSIIRKNINFQTLFMFIVSYSVGGGLVSYLGKPIIGGIFWLGLAIVLLFNLSSDFLIGYYKIQLDYQNNRQKEIINLKNSFLILSLCSLTIGAVITVLLIAKSVLGYGLWVFLGLYFVILVCNSFPPFNFFIRGYGELLITLSVIGLSPLFSYFLQTGELHPTLLLITFPASFLLLAFFLAQSLENYYENVNQKKNNLMTILGWKNGMKYHNYFLLFAYFLYGVSTLFGLSFILYLPAIASLPIAGMQFWEMWRIGEGYKPRWKLLRLSSLGSISVLAYFLLFILWLR